MVWTGSSRGGLCGNAGGGGGTCTARPADYCACLPEFTATQVVDGVGDEFAAIPAQTFALSAAPYTNPTPAPDVPEVVTVRAGWSGLALHAHVHVEDPAVVLDSASTLWNGDNVQFFLAGTANLTGAYEGTEDGGAIHVLVSAPDEADTTRAVVIYQNVVATTEPFAQGTYAARRVADGYEVELQLTWAANADPRQSGARVGFDLVVGAASSSSVGLELEGGLANNPVSSSPPCELGGRVQPGCDDRTWCTPMLQ